MKIRYTHFSFFFLFFMLQAFAAQAAVSPDTLGVPGPIGTYKIPNCGNQDWATFNDSLMWNEPYWWDSVLEQHNLCEEPTILSIAVRDSCSLATVHIKYRLFLDLDGDGTMETLVDADSTGVGGLGWNKVWYNNANGSAGIPRSFDERPVPADQKYGFAIQLTATDTNKIASVRFNTEQFPDTFLVPQLPEGRHKIQWMITDSCGSNKAYEYTFTVRDCKPPTVVCKNPLVVNVLPNLLLQLGASDFVQYAEDNCSPSGHIQLGIRRCGTGAGFPMDALGMPITNLLFSCSEVGDNCIEIWAMDQVGNIDSCNTILILEDHWGDCEPNYGLYLSVSGKIQTASGEGMTEETVSINGSNIIIPNFSYFTMPVNGDYQFTGIPLESNNVITVDKNDNPLNGVSTYDLVLISKHILGTETLDSPYKMIAADANKSGSITTFDIVELRKLILGIYNELPVNSSWRFVDKSYVFPNPNNPFQSAFPEEISLTVSLQDVINQDFIGIKVGDVNNTAVPNFKFVADDRTSGVMVLDVADRMVKRGEKFDVSFKSSQFVEGFQFTLNLHGLEMTGVEEAPHVNAGNFGKFADAVTVSIDGAQEFTLHFKATESALLSKMLSISGRITKAEAYLAGASYSNKKLEVALRFDGMTTKETGFELYQNEPNPFADKTMVGFNLPEANTATLTVFDETGRVVYAQKGDFEKGYNRILLDRALLNTTGVLYYKLETATDSATKKMIQAR